MMNKIKPLAITVLSAVLVVACQPPTKSGVQTNDSTATAQLGDTLLVAVLQSLGTASLSDSIPVLFKVVNPTNDTLRFTEYHTPFEGIRSKFLTVTDKEGNEAQYLGPMVKRVMPPPAETIRRLAPGAEVRVQFDLKKAYRIDKAGTYRIQYNGSLISGIANGSPIEIIVKD